MLNGKKIYLKSRVSLPEEGIYYSVILRDDVGRVTCQKKVNSWEKSTQIDLSCHGLILGFPKID